MTNNPDTTFMDTLLPLFSDFPHKVADLSEDSVRFGRKELELALVEMPGLAALREEYARGPAWTTVGIQVDVVALEALYNRFGMPLMLPYQSWIDAIPLYLDGRNEKQIGKATSGMWSPTLKLYLALARIKPEYAKSGTRIHMEATIEGQRFSVPATVVDTPFFDPPRKRA